MKPKPAKQTSDAEYPSFRKFHITRQALATGAAAAMVAAVSGCVTKTSGMPACSEAPEAGLIESQLDVVDPPYALGGLPSEPSLQAFQREIVFPLPDRDRDITDPFDFK
ncbi:MAG: hypothetical protein JXR40_09345 [Pontiellaceae bacterium]|nr:hypothetical protein [Pontiellaceae bacterium]